MKNLKSLLPLAFVLMMTPLVSKAQEGTVTLEFQNAATALELVQSYVKALHSGDVSKMDAQLAPNVMVYGLGGGMDSLNRTQHKEYFTNSINQYKHSISEELYLPVKVTNNWNEGEWVLSWGTNTLTHKTTGKIIEVPYHTAARVVNGKIEFLRYWYDVLNILETQGYTVTPPAN
ncbi:nuclear transport factor 2 family protein [Algoriphagus aestuariicola]|uniref:Nuclear transport factor 2 family protein n=1 Tax=Algoriphagus aestuariicola TaxID=1852016 RepID=A0ABS3BTD9_9BACT|nr:nuclear transport factor 2 family protein [Algoriphagus aestuariicola]MBN7802388.1 nuclear transport factor 2 family protein [Algoriphagus aestuariicola]